MRFWLLLSSILLCLAGCGATRWSDTQRTATEQLLISDAIDRAVSRFNFRCLVGKKIYLDATALRSTIDAPYLTSALRQQMFAQGCIVTDKREDAAYIVEARAGTLGTDHREVLFGLPATRVPEVGTGVAGTIPEIPLAKKTEQRAVAKIALFAYNRDTGHPVWQSGTLPVESNVKDLWVLGAGPFQRGSITRSEKVAAKKSSKNSKKTASESNMLSATEEAFFEEPPTRLASSPTAKPLPPSKPSPGPLPTDSSPLDGVVPAGYLAAPSITSGPNSGTDRFWMFAPPQPALPLVPQATPSGTQSPSLLPLDTIMTELPKR